MNKYSVWTCIFKSVIIYFSVIGNIFIDLINKPHKVNKDMPKSSKKETC